MSQHTPGPWTAHPYAGQTGIFADCDPVPAIAVITNEYIQSRAADARLIAAAPAFAKAWALVPSDIQQRIFDALHTPDCEWIEAAISKATH